MATPAQDKYYLRSLHQEIDLFDRKLAHSLRFETFASDAEKTAATDKLKAKRELLVRNARKLVSDGIEFKASDLPRSFRTGEELPEAGPEMLPDLPSAPLLARASRDRTPSHFAGTSLDGQALLDAYRRSRSKKPSSDA